MMEIHPITGTHVLEFTPESGFSREGFEEGMPEKERMMVKHPGLRLMEIIRGVGRTRPGAVWVDLRPPRFTWGVSHMSRWSLIKTGSSGSHPPFPIPPRQRRGSFRSTKSMKPGGGDGTLPDYPSVGCGWMTGMGGVAPDGPLPPINPATSSSAAGR